MAFCPKDLRIVACAGNFTLWHYHTQDKHEDILENDYFRTASCLSEGDVLIIENKSDSENISIKLYALSKDNPVSLLQ